MHEQMPNRYFYTSKSVQKHYIYVPCPVARFKIISISHVVYVWRMTLMSMSTILFFFFLSFFFLSTLLMTGIYGGYDAGRGNVDTDMDTGHANTRLILKIHRTCMSDMLRGFTIEVYVRHSL